MTDRPTLSEERLGAVRHRLLRALMPLELRFMEGHERLWTASLFAPFVLAAFALGGVWLWAGEAYAQRLMWTALAALCFFGRWAILAGSPGDLGDAAGFPSSEQLLVMLSGLDVTIAAWLSLHLGFLLSVPVVGPTLGKWIARGQLVIERHAWTKRLRFLSVVGFVLVPRAASITFGGMIFGRLLGLGRFATLAAVVLGCLLGDGLMYLGSELSNVYFDKSRPVVQYGGLLLGILVLGLWKYRTRLVRQTTSTAPRLREAGKALTK